MTYAFSSIQPVARKMWCEACRGWSWGPSARSRWLDRRLEWLVSATPPPKWISPFLSFLVSLGFCLTCFELKLAELYINRFHFLHSLFGEKRITSPDYINKKQECPLCTHDSQYHWIQRRLAWANHRIKQTLKTNQGNRLEGEHMMIDVHILGLTNPSQKRCSNPENVLKYLAWLLFPST